MWSYYQTTGELENDGQLFHGYSGNGGGKNNPSMQNIRGIGPIPRGKYSILSPHDSDHVGKYALSLVPNSANEMFGREGFYLHGDSSSGNASHGCIVQSLEAREKVWESGDHQLQVVL